MVYDDWGKIGRKFLNVLRHRSLIGSLRIDDFCTTTPFGHVISRIVVLKKLEFTIHSEHNDDVSRRPANFPPFFLIVNLKFYINKQGSWNQYA